MLVSPNNVMTSTIKNLTKPDYRINLLRQIKLFNSLTSEELSTILKKLTIRNFKKNQTILYEEDTNEFMYIILYGEVKVIKTTEDGKEILLAMHGSGDFFGDISLIDKKTLPATVIATTDSTIAIINEKDFFYLLYVQRKILDNLLNIFCSRLRESWNRIQILSFNNAEQRVKTLFLKYAKDSGTKSPDGIILSIRFTHQDLANMIGISRETVTRIIDKWRKEKELIVFKNKNILLTNKFFKNL